MKIAVLLLAGLPLLGQNLLSTQANVHISGTLPVACTEGDLYVKTGASTGLYFCGASNDWSVLSIGAAVPAGSLVAITSGTCSAGWTEATDLAGKTFFGTVAANADVGNTGGSDTITPAGTNSALTFTGSALSTHTHGIGSYVGAAVSAGTPAGTNGTSTVTPLGTIAWPAGVPTHSGTAISDHASHTHTYTEVPNHVHVQSVNSATTGGLNGYGVDTSTNTSSTSGYSTANPTGGVATGTTNGPSATLTHTVSNQGTIAWPAGVPTLSGSSSTVGAQTFTGSALGTHAHTLSGSSEAITAGTPAGTINTPVFTGTQFDNRSAYVKVIFCRKS